VELSQDVLKKSPDDTTRLAICARARVNLCAAYRLSKQGAQAREQHSLAERDLERLIKLDPFDRNTVEGLAVLRVNGAYDLAAEGKPAEAVDYVRRNMPMLEAALKQEPNDVGYRDALYRTHGVAAMYLRQIGKAREAAENWEKVVEFAGSSEKPLRLVEAIEFWIDAADTRRATEAARRASADLPKDSPVALWQRHSTVLDRLARLVENDEQIPADDRSKMAAELRSAANTARERAGIGPIESMLHNAFDFFRSRTAE
jgi:tetratricopeptide (TPR) repeat protein